MDDDVRRVDAEDLARELDERGGLAAADVGDADPQDEGPVELEPDPCARPIVEPDAAAVGLEVARNAAPDSPPARRRLRLRPERRLDAVGEIRQRDVRVERLSHSERVATLKEVPAPQLERVEPELGGEQIHLPLVAERDLHGTEAAHRTRRRVVRVGDARVDAHVRAAVGALRAGGRVEEDERRQQRIGAAVRDDADILREQPPLGIARGAVAELHRVTLLARQQGLRAAPHHLHRAAGTLDDEREERLDRHVLLAAEAAAYVGRDHPHAVFGDAQDPREIAKMLDHLGRRSDGDDAVGAEPGDPGLRLEIRMVDELCLVALLDDGVRCSQRSVDVALLELPARYQVALLVNERRALLERRLGVGHDRQLLVLDVDQLEGGDRSVLGLGGNDRDRLAVVADDAVGEHVRASLQRPYLERLPWHVHPDGVLGHILGGQD